METLREYSVNRFPDNTGGLPGRSPLVLFMMLLIVLLCLPAAAAGTSAAKQPGSPDQKIRITADRLIVDTKTDSAEFIGNVRAAQGSTVITSDRLKVLYDQSS